jgi:hypothetical protein
MQVGRFLTVIPIIHQWFDDLGVPEEFHCYFTAVNKTGSPDISMIS